MDRIKQLLQEQGKQVTDAAIEQKLTDYGINPSNVSEADAKTIAQELEPSAQSIGGLAVSNGASTPSKGKTPAKGRKNAKQLTFKDALVHAAKETEGELSTVENAIRQQKTQYINHRSNSLVSEIRNTSTEIVEAVTDKLMEEKADAETFQQIGTAFAEGLFPLS